MIIRGKEIEDSLLCEALGISFNDWNTSKEKRLILNAIANIPDAKIELLKVIEVRLSQLTDQRISAAPPYGEDHYKFTPLSSILTWVLSLT